MQFSKRLDLFGDEVFASLNQKRRELEAAGRPVWDLSVGTPDFPTPDYIKKALVDSCADDANWKYALHDKDELKQAVEILLGIPLRDAEQNQEASPDFADRFAADINLCRTDPLKHRFHALYPAPAGQILSPISDSGIP